MATGSLFINPTSDLIMFIIFIGFGLWDSLINPSPTQAQDQRSYDEIRLQVETYIEQVKSIEDFGANKQSVEIRQSLVVDLNQDGLFEVFVWIKPRYHQTPPIFIYQVPNAKTVNRLREAFAPGPLQKFNHTLLDVHKTGRAADMQIQNALPMERLLLIANYLKMGSHVMEYQTFSHIERGADTGYYVDLRNQTTFNETDRNSCKDFQFSEIDEIVYGILDANAPEVLITRINREFYIYQLHAFNRIGLFDKKSMRSPVPKDFRSFFKNSEGIIGYRNEADEQKSFQINLSLLL
jgi:hypothetical protein